METRKKETDADWQHAKEEVLRVGAVLLILIIIVVGFAFWRL